MSTPSVFIRLAMLGILVILSPTSASHAQRIYDASGGIIGRVDGNRLFDSRGSITL